MSVSYFFPCLIEGVPRDKTISVEIQARENSFFKSANIEFINYNPPPIIAITFAGAHLFRGKLVNAQTKPCGRVSAYYETSLNCSNIHPTVILTPHTLNSLTWSVLRNNLMYLTGADIGGPPWKDPPDIIDTQNVRYYVFYDTVVDLAGTIATTYTPPPYWQNFYSIVNMEWVIRTAVRIEASKYATDELICVRVAYVWYRDMYYRPATQGHALASASIVPNATSYRVITTARTARDVLQAVGGILNTSSEALFIKPIIVRDSSDVIQLLRKFPQNIIVKVDENGQLVGTDVENIQNTFSLPDPVVLIDYSLPKPRPVSITMKTEGESWRYFVKAKDAYSCPVATLEINNSDVILERQEDMYRLLKHFKLNLQERGHIKCVLLPDIDLYHKVIFRGKTFRVVGYTHRINKNEATTDLTIVEEVA